MPKKEQGWTEKVQDFLFANQDTIGSSEVYSVISYLLRKSPEIFDFKPKRAKNILRAFPKVTTYEKAHSAEMETLAGFLTNKELKKSDRLALLFLLLIVVRAENNESVMDAINETDQNGDD